KSMARTVLLSKRVLKSPFGSFSWAPFGNVSLTAFLRASPMQTMPSCDQTGTPSGREGFFHFTSSITPASAPLMRARSWLNLSPLQPPILRTMSSICWDADASLMPTLCCGCLAPSGPKGSVPCPCGGCSQANNTAAASPPAARIAIAGCAGFSFRLSSARSPNRSIHCGQEALGLATPPEPLGWQSGRVSNPPGRYAPLRRRPPWNSSIAHRSSDADEGSLGVGAAPSPRLIGGLFGNHAGGCLRLRPSAGSVDSLGQRHDDSLRPAHVGHAPDVLVLTDAADQAMAVHSQPVDNRLEVVHFEANVAQPQLVGHSVGRSGFVVGPDEARQLEPCSTVGRPQRDDLGTGVRYANDGVDERDFHEHSALNLETQPDEESRHRVEVPDRDADVVEA